MGLFSRKRDADGLYRGDAPVSAPGVDGAAPTAYVGPPDPGHSQHADPGAATWAADPAASGGAGAPAGTAPYPPVPGAAPGAWAEGAPGVLPGALPGQPRRGQAYAVPGGYPAFSAQQLDPATAAMVQRTVATATRRRGGLVGFLVLVILLAVLVPVGFAVYKAVSAATSAVSEAQARTSNDGIGGRHIGVTRLGEPVEIAFDDATFQVTVFGAVGQPGNAWGYATPGGDPVLVVDAQISRTDAGTERVAFLGWNWSVVGSKDDRVTGDIISEYQPALDDARLVGGETVRGFVTFGTPVTSTPLTVAGRPFGVGLATWQIAATTPKAVTGAVGTAVQAELSRPGFAVTVGKPAVVKDGGNGLGAVPKSGQFLVLDVDFTPNEGTSGHLGIVDSKAFVFTPEGVPPLYSTFGAVPDAISLVSIDASEAESGVLAFDTSVTTGTLELRDGAGRALITWPITLG